MNGGNEKRDDQPGPDGLFGQPYRSPEPERCEICGFERVHVYPADEPADITAVCLHCGSRYVAGGWVEAEGL